MSWKPFSLPKRLNRRSSRKITALTATLALSFGILPLAGVTGVPLGVAYAQTVNSGIKEAPRVVTNKSEIGTAYSISAFADREGQLGTVIASLNYSTDGLEPEWAEDAHLTVNGKTTVIENIRPEVKDGTATWTVHVIPDEKIADGAEVELKVRDKASAISAYKSSMALEITAADNPDSNPSGADVQPKGSESAEGTAQDPGAETAPEELGVAEEPTPRAAFAPRAIQPRQANVNTFTVGSVYREWFNSEKYWSPEFLIPRNQLQNGPLRIAKGSTVDLNFRYAPLFINAKIGEANGIQYSDGNGNKQTVFGVKYELINDRTVRVTLPDMSIGGNNPAIFFQGMNYPRRNNPGTATFNILRPVCNDPASKQVGRAPAREVTPDEFADGSPVYVVTGEPKNEGRNISVLSRQTDLGAKFVEVGRSPWLYNALMYNPEDNWLYAVSQRRGVDGDDCYPAGNLLQIDPHNGEVRNLGPITRPNSSVSPFPKEAYARNNDQELLNAGVWTEQGYFVANTATSGTRKMYKVDIDRVTAVPVFGNQVSYSEDWAVLPDAKQFMWGFKSRAALGSSEAGKQRMVLERINTVTGQIDTWDLSDLSLPDGRKVKNLSGSWGKAWTYSNGNMGFGTGSNSANQLGFELKVTNPGSRQPSFELVNIMYNLPSSFNTDAASNLLPPPPALQSNLKVSKKRTDTKVIDSEVRTYWTITVENTTDVASSGGSFTEYFPVESHYGVNPNGPTARFEGIGPSSTAGIYAGVIQPPTSAREIPYMSGYIGKVPPRGKVDFVFSAPVRKDAQGNLKTVCAPNRVKLSSADFEAEPGDSDNVAAEACFRKVAVDSAPQPIPGTDNEFTATYNVVVEYPNVPGFESNEVIYGRLLDTPQFVDAASVMGATMVFKDEFNRETTPVVFEGPGPYELNKNDNPRITKPVGVEGSTGQHVYTVTVRFKLDPQKLNDTSVPAGFPAEPKGNYRCYESSGTYAPNFGLVNQAEMGGWKESDCIPLTPPDKKMNIFLQKVSFNPEAPNQIQTDNLLGGAEFTVYRGDAEGNLKLNADGSVNTDSNPVVQQSATNQVGLVELRELEAPGTYFLVETKAPIGHSLLAEPVKFSTNWNEDGSAQVKVLSGGGLAVSGNECNKTSLPQCDSKTGILQIADVTKGELPKTGGSGIGLWMLLGTAFIVAGWITTRRRSA